MRGLVQFAGNEYSVIQPGAQVMVRFDALPEVEIEGKVISVSPAADDKSRQFPVRVSLNDPRPKAGMAAYGRLLTEEPRKVVAVKRDAIVMSNLGEAVYVMQPPAPNAKPPMEGMPPLPTVNQVLITSGESVAISWLWSRRSATRHDGGHPRQRKPVPGREHHSDQPDGATRRNGWRGGRGRRRTATGSRNRGCAGRCGRVWRTSGRAG